MFPQVRQEIYHGLEQDQQDERGQRRPERVGEKAAYQDRHVQRDDARVGLGHLLVGRDRQVLLFAEEVDEEGDAVAQEERGRGYGNPARLEAAEEVGRRHPEEQEDEDPVHRPEEAVVKDEKDDPDLLS